jgi:2-dehydropantoate 2-reductase
MRITFFGAGAMGGALGASMIENGLDVQHVDVWQEHVDAIKAHGITIDKADGSSRKVKLDIYSDYRDTRPADLAIIFTKGYDTLAASKGAAEVLDKDGLVLTLQNGLGNADVVAQAVEREKVLTGTTTWGATVRGPGHIINDGTGLSVIGPWGGAELSRVQAVADTLIKGGVNTEVRGDISGLVWEKLMANVGINAIVALTGITNGQILDMEITKELSRKAVEEGMAVARAKGISMRDDAVEHAYHVARDTYATRSSMGQDVDARRMTEIDNINGAIVRMGKEEGIGTPL